MTVSDEIARRYRALFDLTDLVAVVTGGGGGLGSAIARGLAAFGARLVIADLDGMLAGKVAQQILAAGGEARATTLDVTRPAAVRALAGDIAGAEGRADILVNAAGVLALAPAEEMSLETWARVLDVNLTGIFLTTQAIGSLMLRRARGKIVNLASVSSVVANPGYAAYAASKGGVAQLTRVLGVEWCRRGVNVNAIGPAIVETELTRAYLGDATWRASALGKIPMGRFGTADDLVGATVFLASSASDFMVGQTIYVDGGRTLG
jgi:NAD(P)-dependent dehydrogenase (short-subunit alcohol dehydrogenase family)